MNFGQPVSLYHFEEHKLLTLENAVLVVVLVIVDLYVIAAKLASSFARSGGFQW